MKNQKTLIAPSILSADFGKMREEVANLSNHGADLVHCDVMDGVFVPNITFGFKMINDVKKFSTLPFDVHLMIVEPERYVDRFIDSGADFLTIHYEACKPFIQTLEHIKKRNIKCGAVISPDTDTSVLKESLPICDMVLLMSVYPGFGGQKFIEKSISRLNEIKEMAKYLNPNILIEIDGGVTFENSQRIIDAGANVLVAGNTIFTAKSPANAIAELRGKCRNLVL